MRTRFLVGAMVFWFGKAFSRQLGLFPVGTLVVATGKQLTCREKRGLVGKSFS